MTEPEVKETEKKTDPIEAVAMKLGWKPNFQGDGAVDAETFILRSRDINSSLNKTVHNLRKDLDAMREGVEVVKWTTEQAHKREIARLNGEISDLKAQRKQAIEAGNVAAVEQYDQQIAARETAAKEEKKPEPKPSNEPHPEFQAWVDANEWYRTDREMNAYAEGLAEHPEVKAAARVSYKRMMNKVTQLVKREFPERFEKPPAEDKDSAADDHSPPAAPVTPSRQRAKPSKQKVTAADLTFEQKTVGKQFVAQGLFETLDDYAKSLHDRFGGE